MKVSGDALKELGWRELEKVAAFPGLTDTSAETRLYIPGGGITKGLYMDGYVSSVRDKCLVLKPSLKWLVFWVISSAVQRTSRWLCCSSSVQRATTSLTL